MGMEQSLRDGSGTPSLATLVAIEGFRFLIVTFRWHLENPESQPARADTSPVSWVHSFTSIS